jgi:hypothetical protein
MLEQITSFRDDFITFDPRSVTSRVGGVGADVQGSGTVKITLPMVYGHFIRRKVYALNTLDVPPRSAQPIGRLHIVSWMQTHNGCEIIFPTYYDVGMLMVPRGMGVLRPSGNGLFMLTHEHALKPRTPTARPPIVNPSVAVTRHCNPILWHCR